MDTIGGGLLIIGPFMAMEFGIRKRFYTTAILAVARAEHQRPAEVQAWHRRVGVVEVGKYTARTLGFIPVAIIPDLVRDV